MGLRLHQCHFINRVDPVCSYLGCIGCVERTGYHGDDLDCDYEYERFKWLYHQVRWCEYVYHHALQCQKRSLLSDRITPQ